MVRFNCKAVDFSTPSANPQYPPSLMLEPTHMKVNLTFDLENKIAVGTNTITIRANVEGASEIDLDAIDFSELLVELDNGNWEYDEETLQIRWKDNFEKGETREVKISYKIVEPIAGLYFSFPDEIYPDRPIFVGSDHETERARYWLPCVDSPAVRTTFDWFLTANKEYTILAIGEKQQEINNEDGTKTVHWKHTYPCPSYIASIAIGKFSRFDDEETDAGDGPIPVAYFADQSFSPEDLERSFGRTPEMIKWLTKKVNYAMPWPKYYQFALRDFGGAMENQSLVSWDDQFILNEELAKEWTLLLDLINIHEMAHTFFGDMVVIRDFGHAWLKESWATYIEALWLEDNVSEEEFRYEMYSNATRYFEEADNHYIRPIVTRTFESSWEMFDRHLYPGGAWRLHMLRKNLGEKVFWEAIQDYIQTFDGKVVETTDFMRILENHSGKSLAQFFDQWVLEAKGYPRLKVKFTYDSDKSEGKFDIVQQQIEKKKDGPRSRPFKFDIDLAWMMPGSSEYDIYTVNVDSEHEVFIFKIDEKPDHVRLDPDSYILHKLKLNTEDKLIRNQLKSPDIVGRIQAAHLLSKTGKMKNIQSIGEAYSNQEYWGVKVEFIIALVDSSSRFAIDPLLNIMGTEEDPMVMNELMKKIGSIRDRRIENKLVELLNQDLAPLAKQNCLISIGKQRNKDRTKLLKSYLDDSGWRFIARRGAYRGLTELRSENLVDLLIEKTIYGQEEEEVRRSVISSLVNLSKWFDNLPRKQVIEQLIDLLRDDHDRIRLTSVMGLGTLHATNAISHLKQIKGEHPKQDRVTIDKIIRKIRKYYKENSKFKEMREKIEKLSEKVDKLDEQLQNTQAKLNSK